MHSCQAHQPMMVLTAEQQVKAKRLESHSKWLCGRRKKKSWWQLINNHWKQQVALCHRAQNNHNGRRSAVAEFLSTQTLLMQAAIHEEPGELIGRTINKDAFAPKQQTGWDSQQPTLSMHSSTPSEEQSDKQQNPCTHFMAVLNLIALKVHLWFIMKIWLFEHVINGINE